MGGSKKGEHRGNARKRPGKAPGTAQPERTRSHETPGEIMDDAARRSGDHCLHPVVVDRRIQVARIILGNTGTVEDTTPKEALLIGMRHNLQAYWDWVAMLEQWAQLPVTPETIEMIAQGEREAERLLDKMGDFAFKAAPFVHPKKQAMAITEITSENQVNVLQELFDEVDSLERNKPIPIEHKTRTG